MSLDREKQLVSEGFERVKVQPVALPHTVWKLSIEIEFDRPLTLAEETVLRLVDAGVTEPSEMTRLMGLDAGVIVPTTIVNLLERQLLAQVDALQITPLGRHNLRDQRTRQSKTYEVEARHDPYADRFLWKFDSEELKQERQVRQQGLQALPPPAELRPLDVEVRHAEIQDLLNRHGLPFGLKNDAPKGARVQGDIVRMVANGSYPAWRRATLEVWYHLQRGDWEWRLLYGGGEDKAISAVLRRIQQEGMEILPLEEKPREPELGPVGQELHRIVEVTRPRSRVIETADHRAALEDAIDSARTELIVVSPWLTTAAVDNELISWLSHALDRQAGLQIIVGYGIERDTGRRGPKEDDQREALKRLNELGQRKRGRLRTVEVGNTHEKIVIWDRRYAIITSFNWLSFNPRPSRGVRREMGYRVEEAEAVAVLRASLAAALRI